MWILGKLRYKIAFVATEPEAPSHAEEKTIEIICFGAVAEEMVGLPADNLVSLSSNVQGYVPEQIKRLYGARFDFKFSVPRGAVRRGKTTFRVDSFARVADLKEQQLAEPQTCMHLLVLSQLCIFCPR